MTRVVGFRPDGRTFLTTHVMHPKFEVRDTADGQARSEFSVGRGAFAGQSSLGQFRHDVRYVAQIIVQLVIALR